MSLPVTDVYANPVCAYCVWCKRMRSTRERGDIVELCRDAALIADSHGWCEKCECLVSLDMTQKEVTGEINWTLGCFEPVHPDDFKRPF